MNHQPMRKIAQAPLQDDLRLTARDVIRRHQDDSLITIEDLPFVCSAVWNAGTADGMCRTIMLPHNLRLC